MTYVDFLLWVRGPAFHAALAIFIFGVILRFFEILLLGRKTDYSTPRNNGVSGGLRTIFSRSLPEKDTFHRSAFVIVAGYVFHIGLFIVILFFEPHIILIDAVLGIRWPGLPTLFIEAATVATLLALIAILINRLTQPVLRFLSTTEDYLVWFVTFLPMLTGFMTFHHIFLPYPLMLALHILSVELLLIVFPFTKLMHTFTLFFARWYNGFNAGRKGVEV